MFNYSSLTSVAACNDYLDVKCAELSALNTRLANLQQRLTNNQGPEGTSNLAEELANAETAVAAIEAAIPALPEGPLRRKQELMLEDAEKNVVRVHHKIRTLGIHGVLNLEVEVHEMQQRIATRQAVIAAIITHRDSLPPDVNNEAA